MLSKFRNAGQTCVCANRLLVQDGIHDVVVQKLTERLRALRVGLGTDDVGIGPLINQQAVDKVRDIVADAVKSGALLLEGGATHPVGTNFFQPTILDNVIPSMEIARTEIFGPVIPIIRFQSEADAISISNDTPYGLAAYFYARDLGRVWRVMESLEYGMVAVNEGALSSELAPFGGIKQSGLGREGSLHGLDEYLEIKYALIGGLSR